MCGLSCKHYEYLCMQNGAEQPVTLVHCVIIRLGKRAYVDLSVDLCDGWKYLLFKTCSPLFLYSKSKIIKK